MDGQSQRIVVVDLKIPFFRLVLFFVKAALAAIPAVIILALIVFVLSALAYVATGGFGPMVMQRL